MTEFEAIKICFSTYREFYEKLRESKSYEDVMQVLRSNYLHYGICHFAYNSFYRPYRLLLSNLLLPAISAETGTTYLYKTPEDCTSVEEILDTLQFRITFLNNLIKTQS